MKKFFTKLLLITICVTSLSTMAFANNLVPEEMEQKKEETEFAITRSVHEEEYKRVLVDSKTKIFDLGAAEGQPRNGVKFPSGGGTFYWTEGGSPLDFYVTLSAKVVSVSLVPGKVTDRVTQYGANAPGNVNCKLGVKKTVTCKQYKVLKRLKGTNTWREAGYTTDTECSSISFYIIRC